MILINEKFKKTLYKGNNCIHIEGGENSGIIVYMKKDDEHLYYKDSFIKNDEIAEKVFNVMGNMNDETVYNFDELFFNI